MLRIHETAVELVAELMPLLETIERRDPDLARQGRRAVMSTPLNIAEGGEQPGKRRTLHYRIAMGSAREAWSVVRVAHAARYIAAPSVRVASRAGPAIGVSHASRRRDRPWRRQTLVVMTFASKPAVTTLDAGGDGRVHVPRVRHRWCAD
jgi:four helix bundle protein